ncbi:ABC transporter ATP-binding protein [Rhizobium mongolense]|uniref:Peptide/nickel transport system ATP-binding protein n=1 Tax=Rhizobium mongolense TaxID=57676 RepID=A0A7W6RTP7_9HYPH|nr:ABC transporter ATP-binding protein [Rhizobium mongolense]MBB4278459.1 peptide/nickel transport system ATP-binding protein [Rhizobium mongolense]
MTALLKVSNLVTEFGTGKGQPGLRVVNDVSFTVARGKVLGLVGESGSGKSVTGFSIMRLLEKPGRIAGGQIVFDGTDIVNCSGEEMRQLRGKRIAMVFQDPTMTLNPVLTIGTQMVEAVQAHEKVSKHAARQRSQDVLGLVGIPSPEERLSAYPHQFSGGMRQRVAIAIALLHKPDLIIADEPTTALDVTIQSQIISEFQKLTEEANTAVIWITHDLAIVSRLADDIAVMYAGRLVETGPVAKVLTDPYHPYTAGLIASVPSQNKRGEALRQIRGITPAINRLPQGCSFRTRCDRATNACLVMPGLMPADDRSFRCIHPVMRGLHDACD